MERHWLKDDPLGRTVLVTAEGIVSAFAVQVLGSTTVLPYIVGPALAVILIYSLKIRTWLLSGALIAVGLLPIPVWGMGLANAPPPALPSPSEIAVRFERAVYDRDQDTIGIFLSPSYQGGQPTFRTSTKPVVVQNPVAESEETQAGMSEVKVKSRIHYGDGFVRTHLSTYRLKQESDGSWRIYSINPHLVMPISATLNPRDPLSVAEKYAEAVYKRNTEIARQLSMNFSPVFKTTDPVVLREETQILDFTIASSKVYVLLTAVADYGAHGGTERHKVILRLEKQPDGRWLVTSDETTSLRLDAAPLKGPRLP
ncbi:MAG: hypothetical protein ACOY94_21855 [Bacillota bacterium]